MPLDFKTILASTVIAAAVSAVVTLIVNYKKLSLDFITAERAEWRLRLKTAMCELVNADTNTKSAVALQKIKSELNPYGSGVAFEERYLTKKERFCNSSPVNQDYYLRDSHIWKALSLYEHRPSEQHLQILLFQLELLIKYDWERSKSEVKSETKWFALSIVFSLVGIACFVLAEWTHMSLVGHAEINKLLNLSICGLGVIIIPYLSFSHNLPRWIFVADIILWIILGG